MTEDVLPSPIRVDLDRVAELIRHAEALVTRLERLPRQQSAALAVERGERIRSLRWTVDTGTAYLQARTATS